MKKKPANITVNRKKLLDGLEEVREGLRYVECCRYRSDRGGTCVCDDLLKLIKRYSK